MKSDGFSLVELSIVLVILGLLTGGILSGQSLIRAAELRSITTEFQNYQTAIATFRDRYMALAGDMPNATKFWGKDNAACASHDGTAQPNGTCNGNGDGQFTAGSSGNQTTEMFQIWKHLALAGLIEGTYTGLSGTGWADAIIGQNVPASRLSSAGWSAQAVGAVGDTATWNLGGNHNFLIFGRKSTASITHGPALKPEEAWNIDTKLDDGRPGYGRIVSRYWNNLCTAADNGSHANNNLEASYRLQDSSLQCALYLKVGL